MYWPLSLQAELARLREQLQEEREEREKISNWIGTKLRATLQNMSESMKKAVSELYNEIEQGLRLHTTVLQSLPLSFSLFSLPSPSLSLVCVCVCVCVCVIVLVFVHTIV